MAPTVHVDVDPGICGFCCRIAATSPDKKVVRFTIHTDCGHVQKLSTEIGDVRMRDLFVPFCRSPLVAATEKAGCHPACPVPTALTKAAEAALGLALPKDVTIQIRVEG